MDWRKLIRMTILGIVLTSCTPREIITPAPGSSTASGTGEPTAVLTAYHTQPPPATATPTPPGTPTPLPSLTPTPRTHTVARGEDLGGIAYRYQVSLDELIAANPDVNPYAMSVGTVLVIPGSAPAATEAAPQPTADGAVRLSTVKCARARDGGAWCFVLASNPTQSDYESVSAVIRVASPDGSNSSVQTAYAGLNLLPAGAEMGLAAYFPAPVPQPLAASAELASSLPRSKGDGRYLPVKIENQQVDIASDGLSARMRGEVVVTGKTAARQVRLAATAFSSQGIAGVRRWEKDTELPPGTRAAFDFTVYSTGEPIQQAVLLAEARP